MKVFIKINIIVPFLVKFRIVIMCFCFIVTISPQGYRSGSYRIPNRTIVECASVEPKCVDHELKIKKKRQA